LRQLRSIQPTQGTVMAPKRARFETGAIADALRVRAPEVAKALLGEPNRSLSNKRELRFHRKGSLAVVIEGAKSGQWYAGVGGDLINLIQHVHGSTFREALACAEQFIGSTYSVSTKPAPSACAFSAENDSRRNQHYADDLWREASAIDNTPASAYLDWRHVLQPALDAGDRVLRFHPNCRFGSGRHACLLALRRDLYSDEPRAIQRIALPDMYTMRQMTFTRFVEVGGKITRMTLGPKTETAIKLSSDEIVIQGLTIGEGLETVLAGMAKSFCPAWALGDADSVENFPIIGGIEALTILVDNDASGRGQCAALECSARWTGAGREVLRAVPNQTGYDFNDVLMRSAAA
jgi:putative DNA primase/helicase